MSSPGAREQIAQVSKPLLTRIHTMPRWLVPVLTLALVAIGALAPIPFALPALAIVLAFVAWIAYLAWPVVPGSGRLLRVIMIGLIVAIGISRFVVQPS